MTRPTTPSAPFALLTLFFAPAGAAWADAWNSSNNPTRFEGDLQYEAAALPASGEPIATPWLPAYQPEYA